ncbi:hypothetical protein ACOJQI_14075 [Bacillus salacetis]|uniref:hypothetical protein n=1 Tax=Bacillus salacetis TaxID=2315464 RepID=UPI003BA0AEC9
MNITHFYNNMSRYYLKRALASLLLGVLLSLFLPGLHILFYLLLIILGFTFSSIYLFYNQEVKRTREALKLTSKNINQSFVINKAEQSYCFFGFDGLLKARIFNRGGSWEDGDRKIVMKRGREFLKFSIQGISDNYYIGRRLEWIDNEGNEIIFKKSEEGWALFMNEEKVCSLTRGRIPLQKQQLFDPSSIVVHFEERENVLSHRAFFFIVLLLEDFYVI